MFGNLLKLILISSGLSIVFKRFFENIILIMPYDLFSFKTWLSILFSGGIPYTLGLLICMVIGFLLSVHRRYAFGIGFILLFLATAVNLGVEIYRYELLRYFMQNSNMLMQGIKFKLWIEMLIQLIAIMGLLFIYCSNLPQEIDCEEEEQMTD